MKGGWELHLWENKRKQNVIFNNDANFHAYTKYVIKYTISWNKLKYDLGGYKIKPYLYIWCLGFSFQI